MTAITDAQTAYVRAKSGDDCTPPVVSDTLLQTYFDTAESDLATTIVAVLEDRWAKAKAEAGKLTDFGTSVDTANIQHIYDLLVYWRAKAGIFTPLPALVVGVMSLGLDATEDDL